MGTGLFRWRSLGKMEVVRQARPLLGTFISIVVHHADFTEAQKAIGKAFAAVEKTDQVMSIHRPESDISRLNAAAGKSMVGVDPSLIEILKMAKTFHDQTRGAYDAACLPLMRLYGFYSQTHNSRHAPARFSGHTPTDREIAQALDGAGPKNWAMDEKQMELGLTREKAAIDLGSIGKGYALDRAGEALLESGIENFLVDGGGNLLGFGSPVADPDPADGSPTDGWRVAIRNPNGGKENPYFETLTLRNNAVATSGNYEQFVRLDGRKVGHLFDMRSGRPANGGISVTVTADNAAMADALSTSLFLLGPSHSHRLRSVAKEIYFHGFGS